MADIPLAGVLNVSGDILAGKRWGWEQVNGERRDRELMFLHLFYSL